MNFKSIYIASTTPSDIKDVQLAQEQKVIGEKDFASGLEMQNYMEWVKHPVTQNLLTELQKEIKDLEQTARNLACTTEQHQQITKHLVGAEMLRKIETYVRTKQK